MKTCLPIIVVVYDPVYLIIEGRVNCIAESSMCFKTFIKGSYFGDIEIFQKSPRLFSVKAETHSTLAMINVVTLEKAFEVYKQSKIIILGRAMDRQIKINMSLIRIKIYGSIKRNDLYWNRFPGNLNELHWEFQDWLDNFKSGMGDT